MTKIHYLKIKKYIENIWFREDIKREITNLEGSKKQNFIMYSKLCENLIKTSFKAKMPFL